MVHVAAPLADGRVLVAGGYTGWPTQTYLAPAEMYAPATNTWTAAAPLSAARAYGAAVPLAVGRVFVAGGASTPGGAGLATVELYRP